MMRDRRLRSVLMLVVIGGVGLLGYILYGALNQSTVEVRIADSINPTKTAVTVGSNVAALRREGEEVYYVATVPSGTYQVRVSSEGYTTLTQDVTTGFREDVLFEADLEQPTKTDKTAQETATEVYRGGSAAISNARYFGDNTWLVFTTGSSPTSNDGSVIVARYSGSEWTPVEEGTDITGSSPALKDAPEELKRYLETVL